MFFKNADGQWVDAWDAYGVSLESEGLSKLMTPAPHKDPVQNKNMAMNGTSIVGAVGLKDVRTVSLPMHIVANTKDQFLRQYGNFCTDILDKGWVHVKTKWQPTVVYHLRYIDCQPFREYKLKMAVFVLSMEEPNPAERT